MPDSLAPEVVEPLLRGSFGRPYRYLEVAESTQRMLSPDDPEGTVAAAEEQTEGRGRLGRSWHSPARTSVLASILLRPAVPPPRLPDLTLVAGEAVARAIAAETGLAPTIKHPNDLLIEGKKVTGILAESIEGRVVLGIGVNANQTADQLPDVPATSLRLEFGQNVDRARLLAAILAELEGAYEAWVSETAASG